MRIASEREILEHMAHSSLFFSAFAIKANDLKMRMEALQDIFDTLPDWIPANTLTETTGLTVDAIRAQIQNPYMFEPEAEIKQIGRIWYIHKRAVPKVRRQK